MRVSINQNPKYISAIKNNWEESRYRQYVDRVILDILKDFDVYLFGGAVRDPIAKLVHKKGEETRDFDILVDDSKEKINLGELLKELDLSYSRFCSPKWKPEKNLEIDVVPFSNAMRLRNGEDLPVSLETMLRSCDLNTSAIAYNIRDEKIYDYGALEGITNQEIDLLYTIGIEPSILMCKLVLHSEKLGFKLGQKAIDLIVKEYIPSLDFHIKEYMNYKDLQEKYNNVVERLRDIQTLTLNL